MSAALVRPIPVSTSPLLGSASTECSEVSDQSNLFSGIQEVIKQCQLGASFRNPFELSERKKGLFEIGEISVSTSHLEISYKPLKNAYFAYLLGKDKYCSKIYFKRGDSKEVLSESLFYQIPKQESPLFKSLSNRFTVVCSKMNEEDIKYFIEESKFKKDFEALSSHQQEEVCQSHLAGLDEVIFKIKELVMRIPL